MPLFPHALLAASIALGQPVEGPNTVVVDRAEDGWRLLVDGEPYFVRGMNWGYMPIGENYTYDFWGQHPDVVQDALDAEMELLRGMGVNSIRQFPDIPPEWVEYIYDTYGITTMMNHTMGRYGFSVDGVWRPSTNYADPRTREVIKADIIAMAERYKDTRGILMWMLGNENNYGLSWSSFEIENLPKEERHRERAKSLYSMYGEVIDAIHAVDDKHPVGIANGDLQYSDLIAEYAPNLDVMGSNVYRGVSSRDLFDRVADELELPFLYTEFGSDAYNATQGREDDVMQAWYLHGQWQEIYEHTAGHGRADNAIGGYIFQWSDGWWKTGQTENLDIHDPAASWENDAYRRDWTPGENNMNEEWFGIASKGERNDRGLYTVYPRSAYWMLKDAFVLDPYSADMAEIDEHFSAIDSGSYAATYQGLNAQRELSQMKRAVVANLRTELSMWTVGGSRVGSNRGSRTLDHMESFFPGFRVEPSKKVSARVDFSVLGNVNTATINEIFYESRGEPVSLIDAAGDPVEWMDRDRVRVYAAEFHVDEKGFELEGFYRVGHYHWQYEGDFFGMFQEAYYGPNLDIYNGEAPLGVVWTGKKKLDGLKIAAGPQLFWGANPTMIAKYYKERGALEYSLMHQEDIAAPPQVGGQRVIQEQLTRKTSLYTGYQLGETKLEVGGLWAGTEKIGMTFMSAEEVDGPSYLDSGYRFTEDEIYWFDTLGAKGKVTFAAGPVNAYVQGNYKGRVADAGGGDRTTTITGWSLKDDFRGNQWNVMGGAAVSIGQLQIAPNAIYQKPLDGPLPVVGGGLSPDSGIWYPSIVPRNKLISPFAVLGNREMLGLELLLAFDPTPGTFMWLWDNDWREDANFAGSIDIVYRRYPTSRDADFGWTAEGMMFAFPGAPPPASLLDVTGRFIVNPGRGVRWIVKPYGGTGQADGDSQRLVTRYGVDSSLWWNRSTLKGAARVGDWGPYDYHRDFNLTYPLQLSGDLSRGFGRRIDGIFPTKFGVLTNIRWLDKYSERFVLSPNGTWGNEWELASYIEVAL